VRRVLLLFAAAFFVAALNFFFRAQSLGPAQSVPLPFFPPLVDFSVMPNVHLIK
jgi:hypothetical protein